MSRRDRIRKLVYEDATEDFDVESYGRGIAYRDYPDAEPRHIIHDVRLAYREWKADQIHVTVCVSDVHLPFHLRTGVANFLDALADIEPDAVVVNGDLLDCYSISDFSKDPRRRDLMVDEWAQGNAFLDAIEQAAPDARYEFVEGNHEQRLERILADGLVGVTEISHRYQLDLDGRGWGHTPYESAVEVEGVRYHHGARRTRKHSGANARKLVKDFGYRRVVLGHCHRMGVYQFTGVHGLEFGVEAGGLFDTSKADYVNDPNWQNGFVILEQRGDDFHIDPIQVDARTGACLCRGRYYNTSEEWT